MYCYQCGCLLSEYDYCTSCGADVGLYKKILFASNRLYNDGLEKAQVRDLSGAVGCLRESLRFNKNNIEARNLLGLVYFEMGEVAAALTEWVVSQNIRSEKNIASEYIEIVKSSKAKLDIINQSIRKYNTAYEYCCQDILDLAEVAARKSVAQNPKFLRARQLLVLIEMELSKWEEALREVNKCLEIDHNNTMSLRFLDSIMEVLAPEEVGNHGNFPVVPKRKKDEPIRYTSGNEVIIQPPNVQEPKSFGVSTILNIVIGLVIGVAVTYFLVVPGVTASVNKASQETIKEIGDQLDTKSATIVDLETQVEALKAENQKLQASVEGYTNEDGTLNEIDGLLNAANTYIASGDEAATSEYLESTASTVDVSSMSQAFQDLYQSLVRRVGPSMADNYYNDGNTAYRNEDYNAAIEALLKAVNFNPENADAMYLLANAYRKAGNYEQAIATYERIIELFPGTEHATRSQEYINEISG